jgi:hypothetical protein
MCDPKPTIFPLISLLNPLVTANANIRIHTPKATLIIEIVTIGLDIRCPSFGISFLESK